MKTQIITYLTFNGNCRQAMHFYQECLGGELSLQTLGESPRAAELPPEVKDFVLQASLKNGNVMLMGSDMVPEEGLIKGNAISILVECESEPEIRDCYEKLSAGGEKIYPLRETFFGALFGGLVDRYGHHWLLNYQVKDHSGK